METCNGHCFGSSSKHVPLGDFLLISRSKRENHEHHRSGLQLIPFDSVVEMDLLSAVFSNQREEEREFE